MLKGVFLMKIAIAIILSFIVFLFVGCGNQNPSQSNEVETSPSSEQESKEERTDAVETTTIEAAETTTEVIADPQDQLRNDFKNSIGGSGLTFYNSVHNDTTGRWRCAVIYTSEEMVNHALDYYKAYFTSDDELHFICNLGLKTTTAISVVMGNLQVDVHEYVDKEEHDANILNSGELLNSYWVNIETGEIEKLV